MLKAAYSPRHLDKLMASFTDLSRAPTEQTSFTLWWTKNKVPVKPSSGTLLFGGHRVGQRGGRQLEVPCGRGPNDPHEARHDVGELLLEHRLNYPTRWCDDRRFADWN